MRERWFGATGRRVPEIVLEGELDLADALVLDGVDDAALREAHAHGRPVERSEERRVGKECNGQCRSRWSPYH